MTDSNDEFNRAVSLLWTAAANEFRLPKLDRLATAVDGEEDSPQNHR